MLRRLFTRCLLRPADLAPSREDFEVIGVFNPGVTQCGDEVILLVRVVERPRRADPGCTALPRHEPDEGMVVDQVPNDELVSVDPRVVRVKSDAPGAGMRLTFISHLRVMRSRDGRRIDSVDGPRFMPRTRYETFGVEDPRITRMADRFYFTYVAVSPHGAATALASTTDFRSFDRHGIIFCPENKDVLLYPERIGGRYLAIHRPNPSMHFSPPEMWLARSDDLVHWGDHQRLIGAEATGDPFCCRIGGGCPPVRTERGWLEIYHANRMAPGDTGVGTYYGSAFLADLDNPARITARCHGPALVPEAEFEKSGFLPNVIFPTGLVERDGTLLVYYGAADTNTGVVGYRRDEVLELLVQQRPDNPG